MTEFFSGDKIGNESEDYRKGGMKGIVQDGKRGCLMSLTTGSLWPLPTTSFYKKLRKEQNTPKTVAPDAFFYGIQGKEE